MRDSMAQYFLWRPCRKATMDLQTVKNGALSLLLRRIIWLMIDSQASRRLSSRRC